MARTPDTIHTYLRLALRQRGYRLGLRRTTCPGWHYFAWTVRAPGEREPSFVLAVETHVDPMRRIADFERMLVRYHVVPSPERVR